MEHRQSGMESLHQSVDDRRPEWLLPQPDGFRSIRSFAPPRANALFHDCKYLQTNYLQRNDLMTIIGHTACKTKKVPDNAVV
jgi:hypothetical protein